MTLVSFAHFSPERSCPRRVAGSIGAFANPHSRLRNSNPTLSQRDSLEMDTIVNNVSVSECVCV